MAVSAGSIPLAGLASSARLNSCNSSKRLIVQTNPLVRLPCVLLIDQTVLMGGSRRR